MVKIGLGELQKAKDLIDLANSVPLQEIAWQRNGETQPVPPIEVEEWKYVGLNNTSFAYEYLLK